MTTGEVLLTEADVSRITGISATTLRNYRYQRRGPAFVKLCGAVRYREEDLNAWINRSVVTCCKTDDPDTIVVEG